MRDNDDLIIKFVKEGQAPNDKTPTITVKNQFAKDGEGVIRQFGVVQADGTVKTYEFAKAEMVKRILPWETIMKKASKESLEAIKNPTNNPSNKNTDVNFGTMEEMFADFAKKADALQKEIAAAKQPKETGTDSKLSAKEKELQALYNNMKPALTDKIAADQKHIEDAAGIAFQKMAADLKRQAANVSAPVRGGR